MDESDVALLERKLIALADTTPPAVRSRSKTKSRDSGFGAEPDAPKRRTMSGSRATGASKTSSDVKTPLQKEPTSKSSATPLAGANKPGRGPVPRPDPAQSQAGREGTEEGRGTGGRRKEEERPALQGYEVPRSPEEEEEEEVGFTISEDAAETTPPKKQEKPAPRRWKPHKPAAFPPPSWEKVATPTPKKATPTLPKTTPPPVVNREHEEPPRHVGRLHIPTAFQKGSGENHTHSTGHSPPVNKPHPPDNPSPQNQRTAGKALVSMATSTTDLEGRGSVVSMAMGPPPTRAPFLRRPPQHMPTGTVATPTGPVATPTKEGKKGDTPPVLRMIRKMESDTSSPTTSKRMLAHSSPTPSHSSPTPPPPDRSSPTPPPPDRSSPGPQGGSVSKLLARFQGNQ